MHVCAFVHRSLEKARVVYAWMAGVICFSRVRAQVGRSNMCSRYYIVLLHVVILFKSFARASKASE